MNRKQALHNSLLLRLTIIIHHRPKTTALPRSRTGSPVRTGLPAETGRLIRLRSSHTRIRTAPGSRPTEIFGTIHDQTRRNLIETICHTAAAIRTKIRIHTRMDIVPAITVSKTVLRTIIHIITGALISCLFRYRAVILPKPL